MKKSRFAALTLSASLLLSGVVMMPADFGGQATAEAAKPGNPAAFDQKIISRIDAERIYSDVRYLSETIGPRVAGTAEEREAASLIRERLESYGYQIEVQEFSIPDKMVGHLATSNGDEVKATFPSGSGETPEEGLTAQLYDAGFGYPDDFTEAAEGKIALISRGELSFRDKIDNAAAAGAAGVIIYDNSEASGPPNLSIGGDAPLPVAGIKKVSGEALLEDVVATGGTVTLKVDALTGQTSQNIIATRAPKNVSNPDIVHVSAHFDSVPLAPGASDNATGTSTALEIARVLKSYPIDKEVRFAFVGAEEIGLVGSAHYVSTLTEDEVSRSIANFNMDMVGTAWENATAIYMNTLDGLPNIVTEAALSAQERIGTPSELVLYKRGSSDHVNFHEAGIPAVNFIRREPGTAALEPYYHTPQDTIEFVSQERLKEAGDLVGSALYSVIRKN
ncbi:Zn-dependent amino-or carboxypeptidase, M28 family [Bhargavaea beijingensis]|uniref:Zn-dependent amino-or carboxypeptidase, M28 family n=1 Tax=Bhargavaea beijingensis TaxID=426756 RepID=A0A1G6XK43_9BACL|nr:M28 family peptidase [Bhargavaea beijingensis]SDD77745.1 Zn-dependent amino-or carboxypeptidase, M28 family [Bhargavaea beijingensis]